MNGNGDFPVFTPEVVGEMYDQEPNTVGGLIAAGNTIQQMRTSYMTAVGVQRKRDIRDIEKKCVLEAQYAGDSLWYGWKQGNAQISGETIGLAMIVARNWGNCATECFVTEDTATHYMVSASFIDLENGSTISRPFKQNKNRKLSERQKSSTEEISRQEDITLQIGASKAMRNVVLAATPAWLHARMIEAAKEAISAGLVGEKLKKAIDATIHSFQDKWGVTEAMLVEYVSKPSSSWVAEDLLELKGVYNAIKEGRQTATAIFVKKSTEQPQAATAATPAPTANTPAPAAPEAAALFTRDDAQAELGIIMKDLGLTASLQRNEAAGRWSQDMATSINDLFNAPDEILKAALASAREELREKGNSGRGKVNIQ